MEHVVKLHPVAFAAVASHEKLYLILKTSRDVQEADLLRILEVSQETERQTGKELYASATQIQKQDKGKTKVYLEIIE